jgi:peptide deformylase
MAVRPILIWPDARLSQRCEAIGGAPDETLVVDMFDTMYAAGGRGLAAPQIGVMRRVLVMDCTWKQGERAPVVMADPTIMAAERVPELADEGCLSIPGALVPVSRHRAVTVQWTDATGDIHMGDFDGDEARVIQHEFDHLNGVVTFDRIDAALRRDLESAFLAGRA